MQRLTSRVKRIHRASERAIAKFMTTEQRLQKQNDAINATIDELDNHIASLEELRIAATFRKDENDGIIRRIRQIIRG
jgi:ubiquinone biosynthesis protein UbiJ